MSAEPFVAEDTAWVPAGPGEAFPMLDVYELATYQKEAVRDRRDQP